MKHTTKTTIWINSASHLKMGTSSLLRKCICGLTPPRNTTNRKDHGRRHSKRSRNSCGHNFRRASNRLEMSNSMFTPEQAEQLKKIVAMSHRSTLELGYRLEVLTEQVAKLLCSKDADAEKRRAVVAEIEAEANRRVQKKLIELDQMSGELAALLDDFPGTANGKSPPP